jgi:ABC-type bacteriocin/lantibiotic exporter with double-glycine peptidase domain
MRQPQSAEFAVPAGKTDSGARGSRSVKGAVDLDGVTFGYSRLEKPCIENFALAVAPGEWLAIVGASGSGKSTVAKLIAGLETPWSGGVAIDGRPLAAVGRAALRNALAVVDQQVVLFEGTIRDNIAMWDPTITDEAIFDAAKLACIHDFITSRPSGYEAKLAEDGGNLSGGQRALIDLARAIALKPAILVLDEATAALDAVTEARVMENLRQIGCTVILIAHRLSTVRDADRIVVLDAGQIAETGTHATLLEQEGIYRKLVAVS